MQPSYQAWLWEQRGKRCVDNLKKNGFDAHWVPDMETGSALIFSIIGPYQSFGFGGSESVRRLGLVEHLLGKGKTVFDHWQPDISPQASLEIRRSQLTCDCFFCSAHLYYRRNCQRRWRWKPNQCHGIWPLQGDYCGRHE